MEILYNDQCALTEYLLQRLEIKLAGREEPEITDRLPADKYHLGVLGPWKSTAESSQPELSQDIEINATIEASSITNPDYSNGINQENVSDDGISNTEVENDDAERISREDMLSKRGVPSALGVEFVIGISENLKLDFLVDFAFYTRRFPTWEQQIQKIQGEQDGALITKQKSVSLSDRHVRHSIRINSIPVVVSPDAPIKPIEDVFEKAIEGVFNEEKKQLDVWRRLTRLSIPASACKNKDEYKKYLSNLTQDIELPPIKLCLDIRFVKLPDKKIRISAYLVNKTPVDEKSVTSNATRYIFDAGFKCHVKGTLSPIEITGSAEHYQYDPNIWAIGQSCSVDVMKVSDGYILTTQSLAKYDQKRLVTRDGINATFKDLEIDPIKLLNKIYDSMLDYAHNWEKKLISGEIILRDQIERNVCRKDLDLFKDEASRFHEGVLVLENDHRLLDAFKGMQRVFTRVGEKKQITSWRLFQIGFIVTQLPALAVREGKIQTNSLEFVDVLWFPTGGGKTEAYLGLISCALLYDRLRGKNAGITAWLRFPLRMLSVQQLQRAIKVLHETEKERSKLISSGVIGSVPISLGYLVGKSSTPNQLSNEAWAGKWKLSELEKRKELRDQLRLIRDCPECGLPKVEIIIDAKKSRIKHVCTSCGLELNIFVSDDEIYRYLPSVIIGTVDKLPSVAWQKNFALIWNGPEYYCPEHGYSRGKYCIVYGCKAERIPVTLYDPAPSLQIQDELHLLREELGTFAGHYETLATVCQNQNGLPPKILAATATVEGFDRQSRHLYNLRARRFPARGYILHESFYTTLAIDEFGNTKISRRYVAFRPPALRPPEASADVLEIFHSEIRSLYNILETQGVQAITHKVGLQNTISREELINLLDKYDTTLTYVGSKAHGSRIERLLSDDKSKSILKAGSRQVEVAYLNGESSLDDITTTIENLETASEWDSDNRIDAVIGTSLISHGVDVSRFNLMVMSGMPGRTAEYIQSSSRSGRLYVGIVVVALSSWSLRDQSLYHRFNAYHYHMEHMVEPVPINRFSKFAIDKTLPGILAGILNASLGPKYKLDLTKVADVQKAMYNSVVFSEQEIQNEVEDAYGLNSTIHSSSLKLSLSERLKSRMKVEMRRLRSPGSAERVTDALSNKPMMSLRDVDEPVPFEPKENSFLSLRWLDR